MDRAPLTGRVTADDWETWRDIRLRSLRDSPDAFGSTLELEAEYDEVDWRERMRKGPRVLVVDDGRAVALGGGFPYDETLMVFGMWTAPGHRGRGHATVILDLIVGWARERDLPVVLHVNLANPSARATYEHYGFVATGEVEGVAAAIGPADRADAAADGVPPGLRGLASPARRSTGARVDEVLPAVGDPPLPTA